MEEGNEGEGGLGVQSIPNKDEISVRKRHCTPISLAVSLSVSIGSRKGSQERYPGGTLENKEAKRLRLWLLARVLFSSPKRRISIQSVLLRYLLPWHLGGLSFGPPFYYVAVPFLDCSRLFSTVSDKYLKALRRLAVNGAGLYNVQ